MARHDRRPATWRFALLLVVGLSLPMTVVPRQAEADESDSRHVPRLLVELGGTFGAATSEGDRIYLALHSRLIVLDAAAAPDAPPLGASEPVGGRISSLAVRGGIVVAVGPDLTVFDARDPSAIEPLARIPLPVERRGDAVWIGDQVWLHHAERGVQRFDMRQPAQPKPLGHWLPERSEHVVSVTRLIEAVALGRGRAAVLAEGTQGAQPSDLRHVVLIVDVQPDGEPTTRFERALGQYDVASRMVVDPGGTGHTLAIRLRHGNLAQLTVSADGTPGPLTYRYFPAHNTVVGFGLDQGWLWQVTEGRVVYFARQDGADRTYDPVFSPGAEGEPLQAAFAAGRLLVIGTTSSGWVEPPAGLLPGPDLRSSAFVDVEPAPGGAWAVDLSRPRQPIGDEGDDLGQQRSYPHVVRVVEDQDGLWAINEVALPTPGAFGRQIAARDDRLYVANGKGWIEARASVEGANTDIETHNLEIPQPHAGLVLLDASPRHVLAQSYVDEGDGLDLLYIRRSGGRPEPSPVRLTFPFLALPLDGGAALDEDRLWVAETLDGTPRLRAYSLSGVGAGNALNQGLTLALSPTGVHDASDGRVLLSTTAGLSLIDGRDPKRLRVQWTMDLPGPVVHAARQGTRLWVAYRRSLAGSPFDFVGGGAIAFTDADSISPKEIARIELGSVPQDIALGQDRMWITAGALQAYDLVAPVPETSTPRAPFATPTSRPTGTATASPTLTVRATLTATPAPTRSAWAGSHTVYLPRAVR